jgi:hypothetical protein
MSRDGDIGGHGRPGEQDFGATEEMPVAGHAVGSIVPAQASQPAQAAQVSRPSRPGMAAPVPPARPSEPIQLAQGQSSGESQAAYAAGPKAIPPSRHKLGSDPAPAVIVDGAPAHTYDPLKTPTPSAVATGTGGGLYMAPVPSFTSTPAPRVPSAAPNAAQGQPAPARTPNAPAFAAPQHPSPTFSKPQFAAPLPSMRGQARSETVVINLPSRRGPSGKEKMLAFIGVLVLVALVGMGLLLMQSLRHSQTTKPGSGVETAAVEVQPAAIVPTSGNAPTTPAEPTLVSPPPVAVVAAPAMDAGAVKKPKKPH